MFGSGGGMLSLVNTASYRHMVSDSNMNKNFNLESVTFDAYTRSNYNWTNTGSTSLALQTTFHVHIELFSGATVLI